MTVVKQEYAKIEVIGPTPAADGPHVAHGTRLVIDGKDVPELGDVVVNFPVDGVVEVHARIYLTSQFKFIGYANVHFHVHLPPGGKLVPVEECAVCMMSKDNEQHLAGCPDNCGAHDYQPRIVQMVQMS